MPRELELTVEAWPPLRKRREYESRVVKADRDKKTRDLRVVLELRSHDQVGRPYAQNLPVPVHPEGLTASFFKACGLETAVGSKLRPKDTEGMILRVKFAPEPQSGKWVVVKFMSPQGMSDAQNGKNTQVSPISPGRMGNTGTEV